MGEKKDNEKNVNEKKRNSIEAGKKNLRPNGQGYRSKEEEKANSAKGGRKSGETRRAQRDMRDVAKKILSMPVTDSQKTLKMTLKLLGIEDGEMDYMAGILASMVISASKGDVKAAQFLRDTAGYKPVEQIDLEAKATVENDVVIYLPEIEKAEEVDGEEDDE